MQYIYILEDNPDYAGFLTQQINLAIMIENLPFEIRMATDDPEKIMSDSAFFMKQGCLFFLDIEIDGSELSGIDAAVFVRSHSQSADIIFVTNHPESALLIVTAKVMPLDLIQKNLSKESSIELLHKDLLDFHQRNIESQRQLTYTIASTVHAVSLAKITFLTTVPNDPGTLELYADNEIASFRGNLTDYEKSYPTLFRSHKSFLVNLDKVIIFDTKKRILTFADGKTAEVSYRKISSLKKLLILK